MKREEAVKINYLVGLMLVEYQKNILYGRMDISGTSKFSTTLNNLLKIRTEIADYLLSRIKD